MLPYISSASYTYIKSNYKIWLAPELLQRGEIHYRSEIYYLGHILYRLLTGTYFSVEPTDFEQAVTNISFNITLPTTDTGFISSLLEFFQKTLHPEVDQRMASFDEFTTSVTENFGVTNTYFVKPPLARMLNKLYPPKVREGDTVPIAELLTNRDKSERRTIRQGISAEDLKKKLAAEGEPRKSRALPVIILIVVLGIIAVITLTLLDSPREDAGIAGTVETADNRQPDANRLVEEIPRSSDTATGDDSAELAEKTDVLPDSVGEDLSAEKRQVQDERTGSSPPLTSSRRDSSAEEQPEEGTSEMSEPEKKSGDDSKSREYTSPYPPESDSAQKPDALEEKSSPVESPVRELAPEKPEENLRKDQPGEEPEVQEGKGIPLVGLREVTREPVKLSGDMTFSAAIRRNYPGRRRTLEFMLLIGAKGQVTEVRLNSSLPEDLAAEVIGNLKSWRYSPPRRNNDPVRVWIRDTCRIEIR
jgi:outer membrane biosynthesis protein TonB